MQHSWGSRGFTLSAGVVQNPRMLYAWGLNEDGQCSHDTEKGSIMVPTVISMPKSVEVTTISAGSRHTLFLARSIGKVFSVGWGAVRY